MPPLLTKTCFIRHTSPWYTDELKELKRMKRKAERKYNKRPNNINLQIFREKRKTYEKACQDAKMTYYKSLIGEGKNDQKAIFQVAQTLLYRQKDKSLPTEDNTEILANKLVDFFENKIKIVPIKRMGRTSSYE